jgi:hypothetical protein
MTLAMTAEIIFHATALRGEFVVHQVTEITTESSWKELTDRATITLPRKVRSFEKTKVRELFRRGDAVTIYFGYNGNNVKEFTGYITEVSADIPIKIKLEDEMWKLKQVAVNFSSPEISLKELLAQILPGYEIEALEGVALGGVRFSKTTVAQVLEKLQSDWGLYSYMKGKKLMVGIYYADDSRTVKFHLERNSVSNSLNYKRKEDVLIRIKAISTMPNGVKLEVENIGDKNGEDRQLSFYNITVLAELERLGQMEYEKYKQDGFDGSFTAFGIPAAHHGQTADLKSTLYKDRSGSYYIDSVNKSFGIGGIRQEIQLGNRI